MQNDQTLAYVLRYYPFEDADLIAHLPAQHWYNQQFGLLTRMPYRQELRLDVPPIGFLMNDMADAGALQGHDIVNAIVIDDIGDKGKHLLEHIRSSLKADHNVSLSYSFHHSFWTCEKKNETAYHP
jgi:hypothetical protein